MMVCGTRFSAKRSYKTFRVSHTSPLGSISIISTKISKTSMLILSSMSALIIRNLQGKLKKLLLMARRNSLFLRSDVRSYPDGKCSRWSKGWLKRSLTRIKLYGSPGRLILQGHLLELSERTWDIGELIDLSKTQRI